MTGRQHMGRRIGGPRIIRVLLGAFALCLAFGTLPLTAQPSDNSDKTATVTIDNFSFSPEVLTIKPGTKVTFVNHDDIPHTAVAVDKSFKSKVMDSDESFSFTFTTTGSFDYFCSLHPHMKGRIVVTPE
jgi:plastocyanin